MTWHSKAYTTDHITKLSDVQSLVYISALRRILSEAFPLEAYMVPIGIGSKVALTDYGKGIRKSFEDIHGPSSDDDFAVSAIAVLCGHELLVDHAATDVDGLIQCIGHDIAEAKLRFPAIFGRNLYDKFNDSPHGDRTNHLSDEQTLALLSGTPQGVYQVDKLVTGPLGIILSQEARQVPPTSQLPLWHCSDTGCDAVHWVELQRKKVSHVRVIEALKRFLRDSEGHPSEWIAAIQRVHRIDEWKEGRTYVDLPVIVADCIHGIERDALTEVVLQGSAGTGLRELIGKIRGAQFVKASAKDLARRLSQDEQLQLLLTIPDRDLAGAIDAAVTSARIEIPPAEVRAPKFFPRFSDHDSGSDLSALGLRSVPEEPIVFAAGIIWEAASKSDCLSDLRWWLRCNHDSNTRERLVDYLRENGPIKAAKELILPSQAVTQSVEKALGCEIASGTDVALAKLAWKLGFDLPRYDDRIQRLKKHSEKFNRVLIETGDLISEDRRERVREAGVNYYVSIEALLEQFVAFNVWLLWGDHFAAKTTFDSRIATELVPVVLGSSLGEKDQALSWRPTGANTLGVSLRYAQELADRALRLESEDRSIVERKEADLPHFANWKFLRFPFRHTQFWADCDRAGLRTHAVSLADVVKLLGQARIAESRNGIDHPREPEEFPTLDSLLAGIARFQNALSKMEVMRLLPLHCWLSSYSGNKYGAMEYELVDEVGASIVHRQPSGLRTPPPVFGRPYIVSPPGLLRNDTTQLLFTVREQSLYSEYWSGYPRKRRIPSGTETSSQS